MKEIVAWRSVGQVCVGKVTIIIEKRDVGPDLEYARLEIYNSNGDHCTVYCRDKEFYNRIVEWDMYWLDGVVETKNNGLILVAEELYGYDGCLLNDEDSEYYNNLNPIEIGSLA
jgi:hypothetical protein